MASTALTKTLKSFFTSNIQYGCITRRFSINISLSAPPRIGIVGSGPAGFYTAQYIIKHHQEAEVDIFEKLPVPFGLVRYGVAPDHPDVKNASHSFEEVASNSRCRFFGNVNIGHDIKATDLQQMYDGLVFAYGADDDKWLNIPGENNDGVVAARSFVGWYNGLPAHAELSPLLDCDTAVIVGQGNVALDVARILLTPIDLLKHTDICAHALECLKDSKVNRVIIAGRRSPFEVSFTIKELREMIRLEGVTPIFHSEDFVNIRETIPAIPRPKRRLMELMCKTALDDANASDPKRFKSANKQWELSFLKSPSEILVKNGKVCGIRFEKNTLEQKQDGSLAALGSGVTEDVSCGLVLRSIGYKSIPLQEGIPFDKRLGVIPNIAGRVVAEAGSSEIVLGLYCSGWVKHGPVGVIVTTMNESFATAQNIVEDLNSGCISSDTNNVDIGDVLKKKGVEYVTFDDYQKIDLEETFRGKQSDKPREKIVSSNEMLNIALDKQEQ